MFPSEPQFEDGPLPLVGIPTADEGHARDEAAGFGVQVREQLHLLGYSDLKYRYSGGKSRIYFARDKRGREVAIRVNALYAQKRKRNRASTDNLVRNFLLKFLLPKHPNVIHLISGGIFKVSVKGNSNSPTKVLYTVMNWVEGKTLAEAWSDPAFIRGGVDRIAQTAVGVLSGLSSLYGRGLRHGDMKPRNVVLESKTWNPVIVDLRLSLHICRTWDSDRKDFRRTLRALLTGELALEWQEKEPIVEKALKFWFSGNPTKEQRRTIIMWCDVVEHLAPNAPLGNATPSRILKVVQDMLSRAKSP